MTRREALAAAILAAPLLQSCSNSNSDFAAVDIATQRRLAGLVADAAIPRTDTPGATNSGAAEFMLKAIEDLLPAVSRRGWHAGLQALDAALRTDVTDTIESLTRIERDAAGTLAGAVLACLKQLAVLACCTSEAFVLAHFVYDPVPGDYKPVILSAADRTTYLSFGSPALDRVRAFGN